MIDFKGSHFEKEIIMWGVRWYIAYPISYRNLVEQDHRAVKRLVRPMLGFKSFWSARCTIAGIEVIHAIRKGQLATIGAESQTPAEQFYALAA
jgi:transposase-like protein